MANKRTGHKVSYYTIEYNDGKHWHLGTWRITGKLSARKIAAAYKMGGFDVRTKKETF